jgi:hypothetical protein
MKKTTMVLVAGLLALAQTAQAQSTAAIPKGYFSITAGAQPQQRTFDAAATSEVFGEDAVFSTKQEVSGGPFFDFAAGFRVLNVLHLGAAVSTFGSTGNATGTAAIPDPLFADRTTTYTVEGTDLARNELGIHVQAAWFIPLSRKFDLQIAAGPSLYRASQEFAAGSTEEGSQAVNFHVQEESGFGFGFNAGADFTYLFTPKYGLGVLARYSWGKVGLDAADVTVGGLQAGVGLRIRWGQ